MPRRKADPEAVNPRGVILAETLDAVTATLKAKGLDPDSAPAEFADSLGLKSRELTDLTEAKGQALLSWLTEIPDDQPVEPDNADVPNEDDCTAANNENADSDNDSGNGEVKEKIRKAEDVITIKRTLNADEQQANLDALFKLKNRRSGLESNLEGLKGEVKACQKEIDSIDLHTYQLISDIEENAVEEEVEALRITNYTTGMITWYDRNTGEVLKERIIKDGEQFPLDLAGDAADHASNDSTAEPETARFHGAILEKFETSVLFQFSSEGEAGAGLVLEVPHGQIIDLRARVLEDEPDCIIITQAFALEVGLVTELEEATEAPDDAPDFAELGEDEEQGCSVCAHRDSDDDACRDCGEDLANFMPLAAEPSQEPALTEAEMPY